MGTTEDSLAVLRDLADIGVRIAIDDFGSGYSNLAYLRRLPVHTLKLAGPFITRGATAATNPTTSTWKSSAPSSGSPTSSACPSPPKPSKPPPNSPGSADWAATPGKAGCSPPPPNPTTSPHFCTPHHGPTPPPPVATAPQHRRTPLVPTVNNREAPLNHSGGVGQLS